MLSYPVLTGTRWAFGGPVNEVNLTLAAEEGQVWGGAATNNSDQFKNGRNF